MVWLLCPFASSCFAKQRGFSWLPALLTHKFLGLALTRSAAGYQHGNSGLETRIRETPSISHGAGSRHPKGSRQHIMVSRSPHVQDPSNTAVTGALFSQWYPRMLAASSAVLTTLLPIQHLPFAHSNTGGTWRRRRAGSLLFLRCFPMDQDEGPTGPGLHAVPSLLLPWASPARPQHGHSFWMQKLPPKFKQTTSTEFPLSSVAVGTSDNSCKLLKHDLPRLNVCQVVLIKLCVLIYTHHKTLRRGFQDFLILCIPLDHLSLNSNKDKQNEKDKNSFVSAEW